MLGAISSWKRRRGVQHRPAAGEEPHLTHPPRLRFGPYRTRRDKLIFHLAQAVATLISSILLIAVVSWALANRLLESLARPFTSCASQTQVDPTDAEKTFDWDEPDRWRDEKLVKDVGYYARSCGFDIQDEVAKTEDGFYLRMHRVIDPLRPPGERGGYPVLIMHGLFQSSGSFVTSEERSLAFYLSRKGYQVFLGNNRAVFGMGHVQYQRTDPRFWNWTVEETARYDIPAMVEWVCSTTGYEQIAYIGHSQGNLQMFMTLSWGYRPDLGKRLSYFAALAPALYAGPLTQALPFTVLQQLGPRPWGWLFGWLGYIPLMRISYDWTPALPYAKLGYQIFSYLFEWTDRNWLRRRKNKMFRFTPQPVSSASIYWWTGKDGFSTRGCALNPDEPHWWSEYFPPLAIFSGGRDYLVLTHPLLERIKREPHVQLTRSKRQPEAEHCDAFWAATAVEWTFQDLLADLRATSVPAHTAADRPHSRTAAAAPSDPASAAHTPTPAARLNGVRWRGTVAPEADSG